jgi:lysyl-tRNA synthetase class I
MLDNDKWLDDILERTEREEIRGKIGLAIQWLNDYEPKKALNVLESLYEELDEGPGLISQFLKPKQISTHAVPQEEVTINQDVMREIREELQRWQKSMDEKRQEEIARGAASAPPEPEESFHDYLDYIRR